MSSAKDHDTIFINSAKPLETAIISALLEDASLLTDIKDFISVSDFFTDSAKQIFEWITLRKKEDKEVSADLALSHFMGTSGVEHYLLQVLSSFPDILSIKSNAEALREISVRQELHKNARAIQLMTLKGGNTDVALSLLSKSASTASDRLNSGSDSVRSIRDISEQWQKGFVERCENGNLPGTSTGFSHLDELTAGLQPADLVVVAGRPSMGKTTFAMNIAEHIALKEQKAVLVFSLEMPSEALFQRMIASVADIDQENLKRGKLLKGEPERIKIATDKLNDANIFIDDNAGATIDQVTSKATRIAKTHQLGAIVIDYLQIMKLPREFASDRNNGIGEISRGLKQLAKTLNVPVIILSQLNRTLEQRPNKRPVNSDLRDSGAIEQDADLILFVYRDEVYNPDSPDRGTAEIIIGKQRNGPLGTVRLAFANGKSRFEDIDSSVSSKTLDEAMSKLPDESDLPAMLDSYASFEHLILDENPL